MGTRRAGVLLILAALAGCGGDDDDDERATTTSGTASTIEQDRQARADVRDLAVAVETCFVERQDYSLCEVSKGSEDGGAARVEAATKTAYTIVARSQSGNEFRLVRGAAGSPLRRCTEPGRAGCPANGHW